MKEHIELRYPIKPEDLPFILRNFLIKSNSLSFYVDEVNKRKKVNNKFPFFSIIDYSLTWSSTKKPALCNKLNTDFQKLLIKHNLRSKLASIYHEK